MATRMECARVAVLLIFIGLSASAGEAGGEAGSAADAKPEPQDAALLQELKAYRHKIVFESFRDNSWDLCLINADGSGLVNLTKTPDVDELYPKASPDGSKICFVADEGKGEAKVRNLYVMNIDGSARTKIAGNAREPAWSSDGKSVAFLKSEFDKFDAMDYVTKGIFIYDLASGQTREHPNKKIHHLYCLNWSPDGNWFVATVHGGMGFKHAILAMEANGEKVIDLNLSGCRPDLNFDAKKIAWGHGDYAVGIADLDFSTGTPKAANIHNAVQSAEPNETYHADWSPEGKYIVFTRGAKRKKNRMGLAPEIPSSDAPGWNLYVALSGEKNRWVAITTDGKSNKEPDWVFVKEEGK